MLEAIGRRRCCGHPCPQRQHSIDHACTLGKRKSMHLQCRDRRTHVGDHLNTPADDPISGRPTMCSTGRPGRGPRRCTSPPTMAGRWQSSRSLLSLLALSSTCVVVEVRHCFVVFTIVPYTHSPHPHDFFNDFASPRICLHALFEEGSTCFFETQVMSLVHRGSQAFWVSFVILGVY